MRISIWAAMVIAAIVAVISLGFAVSGFTSLSELKDATQVADARGFAWFWIFLASVAIVLGLLVWWIARKQRQDDAG